MTKPTTDAGRRYSEQPPGSLDEWNVAILAIENEARANVTSHVTLARASLDVEQIVRAALRVVDQDTPLSVGEPLIQKAIRYATNLARLTTEGEKP